jgi:hypothetical protein
VATRKSTAIGARRKPKPAAPATRPLRVLDRATLRARLAEALIRADGPDGAHCIHELWMRGETGLNIESALAQLWDRAARTVPDWLPMRYVEWLPLLYEVAGRCHAEARGRSNVYLVLLDCSDCRAGPYGVYVGMSRYSPAERFDQHKQGLRAAGSVLKRGLEVLTGPSLHLQRIARAEAARIEEELAEALRAAGLFVQGGH